MTSPQQSLSDIEFAVCDLLRHMGPQRTNTRGLLFMAKFAGACEGEIKHAIDRLAFVHHLVVFDRGHVLLRIEGKSLLEVTQ